jgi:hypothetical protein
MSLVATHHEKKPFGGSNIVILFLAGTEVKKMAGNVAFFLAGTGV